MAMAAMMADWLRRAGSPLPSEHLLDRKASDFLALSTRLATPLGDAEIKRLRGEAATAIAEGRFAEADKSLAQAELHAIGGSTDLSALPLERRLLIGENRADRAAISFLRTTSEAYREAAARYGENAGEMTVCKLIEDDAGVELRVAGDWVAPWEVKHPTEQT